MEDAAQTLHFSVMKAGENVILSTKTDSGHLIFRLVFRKKLFCLSKRAFLLRLPTVKNALLRLKGCEVFAMYNTFAILWYNKECSVLCEFFLFCLRAMYNFLIAS